MARRFSNVDHEFFFRSFSFSLSPRECYISVLQSEAVQVGEMILLYKYMYKIRLCMWLTETLCVLHSHALCVYFYSSALM